MEEPGDSISTAPRPISAEDMELLFLKTRTSSSSDSLENSGLKDLLKNSSFIEKDTADPELDLLFESSSEPAEWLSSVATFAPSFGFLTPVGSTGFTSRGEPVQPSDTELFGSELMTGESPIRWHVLRCQALNGLVSLPR
ncbi:hypothetical protein F0562_029001 [Nyssa sinensis]|uniref:Uncharacterized protein n=1 Tax=Nyssa sinensis TaxID=561372 RepID=A0A5J5AZQ5_9ASTE|nr:hypothetical protein F0562_029001 [Nyssa sinensis]